MPNYVVSVELDDQTLQGLENGGFSMQAYKGVKASSFKGALPTLWFSLDSFSKTVKVNWREDFGGYFSNTPIKTDVVVDISNNDSMQLGDVLTLESDGSISKSTVGGVQTAYSFLSNMTNQWTTGLLSGANGQAPTAICAFPQYGAVGNVIEPYEKILLLFTQQQVDTGAVVQTAVSKSVSIIMSPTNPSISLAFNINNGWDTKGQTNARQNPANFALAPDLIVPSASAAKKIAA